MAAKGKKPSRGGPVGLGKGRGVTKTAGGTRANKRTGEVTSSKDPK